MRRQSLQNRAAIIRKEMARLLQDAAEGRTDLLENARQLWVMADQLSDIEEAIAGNY